MGGDFLALLLETHPSWAVSVTCLARNAQRSEILKSAYPDLRIVYGSLDDSELLEVEAARADIVLHFASSDHVGAAEAIAMGLKKTGGFWIHTSGTDVLLLQPSEDSGSLKTFNDWERVNDCTSRPGIVPNLWYQKLHLRIALAQTRLPTVQLIKWFSQSPRLLSKQPSCAPLWSTDEVVGRATSAQFKLTK